jgi:hypothetical protein
LCRQEVACPSGLAQRDMASVKKDIPVDKERYSRYDPLTISARI